MVKTVQHLYPGFRHAGRLPSIASQRKIQRDIINDIMEEHCVDSILSVGCAYGNELDEILSLKQGSDVLVCAIDVVDVHDEIYKLGVAKKLGTRLEWSQIDLLDAHSLTSYGTFSVVQCGFVLHDIDYNQKAIAYTVLAHALRPGGWLVFSDIFPTHPSSRIHTNIEDYRSEVTFVYNSFIAEANNAKRQGILSEDEWQDLVGDEHRPGLKNTLRGAITGSRDFFETLPETKRRLVQAGFFVEEVITNPINSRLAVIVASRSPTLSL